MMLPEVTALICCKDEESNIAKCIESVRMIADEVLVADSGSTDRTLEIAKSLADRVIEREFISMGDFRNWAIPQAQHKWVLIVDADERVTSDLAESILRRLLVDTDPVAYSISRLNYFLGHPLRFGDWAGDRVTRLIARDECRYELHTDHAEIDCPIDKLGRLEGKLTHYTAWDLSTYLDKQKRYARQQAELWHQDGKRSNLARVMLTPILRFLRGYVARFGFLDGTIGFLIAAMTAFYCFQKQFFLWQFNNAKMLTDFEPAVPCNTREMPGSIHDSPPESTSNPPQLEPLRTTREETHHAA